MEDIIQNAQLALSQNDAKKALKILKPLKKSLKGENENNLELLQIFIDSYLENGQVDKAFPLLVRSCELDPQGSVTGSDKFFTLGQIIGGEDGINVMTKGIENYQKQINSSITQENVNKIVNGLLSMIEIWMTDLCMEPNAETECEKLINQAMEVSENQSPEVWSTLGSIRISQQRFGDACNAFTESWKYLSMRKDKITENINNGTGSQEDYVDMLQPMLNLAKMCMEVGLYEVALKVENMIKEIDEDNMETYYLEGFTNYLLSKTEMFKIQNPTTELTPDNIYEFNQHIQDLPLNLDEPRIQEFIHDSRIALSFARRLGENSELSDEITQELMSGIEGILQEIGGPIDDSILQKIRKGELGDDAEDEIDLDNLSDIEA